ncbi:MAG: DUF1007 family protein [Leucothrix sp.]
MKINACLRLVTFTVFFSMMMQTAFAAGFHYQLDLTAKLVNSPDKELTAIQMSWIYDKELSAILMDGEDLSETKRDATLKKRAADILSGLTEVKYFTTALLDKTPLTFDKVEKYSLRLNKESRLQMNLTLPLNTPQTLQGSTLELIVTDDSAVGLATFIDTKHMLLGEQFSAICKQPELVQQTLAEIDGHAQVTETMTIDCR